RTDAYAPRAQRLLLRTAAGLGRVRAIENTTERDACVLQPRHRAEFHRTLQRCAPQALLVTHDRRFVDVLVVRDLRPRDCTAQVGALTERVIAQQPNRDGAVVA